MACKFVDRFEETNHQFYIFDSDYTILMRTHQLEKKRLQIKTFKIDTQVPPISYIFGQIVLEKKLLCLTCPNLTFSKKVSFVYIWYGNTGYRC